MACPSTERLEKFAGTPGGSDTDVARHLDSCAPCRAALQDIRENNRFLTGFMEVVSGVLPRGPEEQPEAPLAPDALPG
jgi:hypothetical protein